MISQLTSALTEAQLTQVRQEIVSILKDNGILISDISTEGNETHFVSHPRGSFFLMDKEGGVGLYGHNSELNPTLGCLSLGSTGNLKIQSGHAILIEAQDCLQTGGALGDGGKTESTSISIFASGDIHIESTGPGGIYIKSPKNLRLEGETVEIIGTQQISLRTGSQSPTGGLLPSVGSGEINISAATIKTSSNTKIDQTLTQHKITNYGHIDIEQLPNPLQPGLPQGNLYSITTTGNVMYNLACDIMYNIGGKQQTNIASVPLAGSLLNGGMFVQTTANWTNIFGTHLENLFAGAGGDGSKITVSDANIASLPTLNYTVGAGVSAITAAAVDVGTTAGATEFGTSATFNKVYGEGSLLGPLTNVGV